MAKFYNIQRSVIISEINKQLKELRSYFWSVFFCIHLEYRKIRTRNNSVFGHFSRSVVIRDERFDPPAKAAEYCSYTVQSPCTKKY